MVVVLHDLDVAASYADQVLLLDGGRIRAQGKPTDVLTTDLLSQVYAHPIEVLHHPVSGRLLILPQRQTGLTTHSPS